MTVPVKPLRPLFFNGAQIRHTVPTEGSPDAPGSLVVADLRSDAMPEARVFAATGRAMARAPEMLASLRRVSFLLGSACLVLTDPIARKIALDAASEARRIVQEATEGLGGKDCAGEPARVGDVVGDLLEVLHQVQDGSYDADAIAHANWLAAVDAAVSKATQGVDA